jgi:hypothetical protein
LSSLIHPSPSPSPSSRKELTGKGIKIVGIFDTTMRVQLSSSISISRKLVLRKADIVIH